MNKKILILAIILGLITGIFVGYYDKTKIDNSVTSIEEPIVDAKSVTDQPDFINSDMFKFSNYDEICSNKYMYKTVMYYNETYPEDRCIFTSRPKAEIDDTCFIYEDINNAPDNMIGVYSLCSMDNETVYNNEGIYIGNYDSYKHHKTVWVQFSKCKG